MSSPQNKIVSCPFCGAKREVVDQDVTIYEIIDEFKKNANVTWSDRNFGDWVSPVWKCDNCGRYSEIDDWEDVDDATPTGVAASDELTFKDMCEAWQQFKDDEPSDRFLHLFITMFNDEYRRGTSARKVDSDDYALFCEVVKRMIARIPDVASFIPLKAEFYREIGNWNMAKKLLTTVYCDENKDNVEPILYFSCLKISDPFIMRVNGELCDWSAYHMFRSLIDDELKKRHTRLQKEAERYISRNAEKFDALLVHDGMGGIYDVCNSSLVRLLPSAYVDYKVLPDITHIADDACRDCKYLCSISLPESLEVIGSRAFSQCCSLKEIVIPNSVTSIGEDAFCGDVILNSVKLPDSLKEIPNFCFTSCQGLTKIDLPDSLQTIGYGAFMGCGLRSVDIPDSVTKIKPDAFSCCERLESVKLPEDITELPGLLFMNCISLKSIDIPAKVRKIGHCALYSTPNLANITFRGKVEINSTKPFVSPLYITITTIPTLCDYYRRHFPAAEIIPLK